VAPGAKIAAVHEALPAITGAEQVPVDEPPETAVNTTAPEADDGVRATDHVAAPSLETAANDRVINIVLEMR